MLISHKTIGCVTVTWVAADCGWLSWTYLRAGFEGSQSIRKTMPIQVGDATAFPAGRITTSCRSACCCTGCKTQHMHTLFQCCHCCCDGISRPSAILHVSAAVSHTQICGVAHVLHVPPFTGPAGQDRARVLPIIVDATCAGVGCALLGYADLHECIQGIRASSHLTHHCGNCPCSSVLCTAFVNASRMVAMCSTARLRTHAAHLISAARPATCGVAIDVPCARSRKLDQSSITKAWGDDGLESPDWEAQLAVELRHDCW